MCCITFLERIGMSTPMKQSGEDFWVKAEKLYYTALIGYIWYECVEEEQNFTTLLDMINASEARQS